MIIVAAVAILLGAVFCLLAAIGMLRFPDIYTRAHAASKAGVLGVGLILVGVAFASQDIARALGALVGIAFLGLTGPVAAHLLTRAALKTGTDPIPPTSIEK